LKPNLIILILFFVGSSTTMFGQDLEFFRNLRPQETPKEAEKPKEVEFKESGYCIESQLNTYLDSVAEKNRKATLIRGFRILLYSGNVRDEATQAKALVYRSLPRADVYTSYQSPTFKVKLGDFYQRMDAYLTLKKIESTFPNAVIMEEVVNLKP